MERELFSWKGWDGEPECMTFYDVVLKKQIGEFPPGTKFDGATILVKDGDGDDSSSSLGILQFYDLGEERRFSPDDPRSWRETIVKAEFKLHYTVGERIS